jgi:NitT/TauT family transport system substrate-binding protein
MSAPPPTDSQRANNVPLRGKARGIGLRTRLGVKRSHFAAGTAALAVASAIRPASAAPVTVRVAGTTSDDAVSLVYAQKSGLFDKAGLAVTFERQNSGAAVAEAIVAGTFDIGKSSITGLFTAHDRGIPFVMIAPAVVYDGAAPYAGLIVRADSPVKRGKDLAGAVVGVAALGDLGAVATQVWVDKDGGDASTIRFVELPFSAVPAAVDEGRIGAGEMSMPTLAVALATGKYRLVPTYSAISTSFINTVWFTTADYIAKNPAVVRAFVRALHDAAIYTNAHHAQTAAMMAEFTGVPLDIVSHMTRATDGLTLTADQLQPALDAAVKYGALRRPFPLSDIIYPS